MKKIEMQSCKIKFIFLTKLTPKPHWWYKKFIKPNQRELNSPLRCTTFRGHPLDV